MLIPRGRSFPLGATVVDGPGVRAGQACELPSPGPDAGSCWRRWIETYRDAPDDVCDTAPASPVEAASDTVQARSLVVLVALGKDETLGAT